MIEGAPELETNIVLAGADAFFMKPVEKEKLIRIVREVLGNIPGNASGK